MTPDSTESFLDDLLYFNSLVLWDCLPEQVSFQLYESAWKEFATFTPLEFSAEEERLAHQRDDILGRVNVLDMVIPLFETISSRSVVDKPLASLQGRVPAIDGLRMRLQRYRKHQFELYYRIDMRILVLDLIRICRQTLPVLPDFKSIARFDRRVSDEGGRPCNWYSEVSRIGHAVDYFSSNRQNKSIGNLQDYIAEINREPVQRHMLGENLKRTCRKWGVSLWAGMGVEGYRSAVNSVWSEMRESGDPLILRAIDRFQSEQKEKRSSN